MSNPSAPDSFADGQPRKPSRLLWWLHPKVALPLSLIGMLLLSPFFYRAYRISSLPDVGDPFDVVQFKNVTLAPSDNAAEVYASAIRMLRPGGDDDALFKVLEHGWSEATPALTKWLDDNDAALMEWRRATEMSEAMFTPPKEMSVGNITIDAKGLRSCSRLAQLKAALCLRDRDVSAAWEWLRAQLRAGRHCTQHSTFLARLVADGMLVSASEDIGHWANDDLVGESHLIQALQDVAFADAMTGDNSVCWKMEHLGHLDLLNDAERSAKVFNDFSDHSEPISRIEFFLLGEPEYSRRLTRLSLRYWLSVVDQPLWSRPKLAIIPPAVAGGATITVAELERLISEDGSLANMMASGSDLMDLALQREATRCEILRQMLACHLYRRRHGDWPSHPEQLVPDVLPKLVADPFGLSGEHLRWKREGDELLIYSIAEDRIDNGGDINHSAASLRTDRGVRLKPPGAKPMTTKEDTPQESN